MIKPRMFTVDDFNLMIEAGLFHDQRVELLDGVIVDMSPASPSHEHSVDVLSEHLAHIFYKRARVRVQNTINLKTDTWLPHPDIALVKQADYSQQRPTAEDVYLLIEVAKSSLELDLGTKLKHYALAGIRDYWIADLDDRRWIINRQPEADAYTSISKQSFDSTLAPLEFPDDAQVWL